MKAGLIASLRAKASVTTVDSHTAGEPTRVVVSGLDPAINNIPTMVERQAWLEKHYDALRTSLMQEPRGHQAMFGAVLTEPVSPEAAAGVIFMYPSAYADMCGHGTIGVVTTLIEMGVVQPSGERTEVILDTPAGLVKTVARVEDDRVCSVDLINVPAYFLEAVEAELPELGRIPVHLSYGIMKEVNKQMLFNHPFTGQTKLERIRFVDGEHNESNVVIHEGGVIDRSPCGTGTCAQMAWEYASGLKPLGVSSSYYSIVKTKFSGKLLEETEFAGRRAVIPQVTGTAYITGVHDFIMSPDDPLRNGFSLNAMEEA
jgi:proline racemase/trans-L-3-hydroxyproline dehydratase